MQRSFFSVPRLRQAALLPFGLLLWIGFAMPSALGQAPANDNFSAASVISGPSGNIQGSNIGATLEPGEPSITGNPGGQSVWYAWTPANNLTITFNTSGSDFDTLLAVYTGTSVGTLTAVGANDNYGNSLQSSVTFSAVAGVTYYISVDGFNAGAGYGASQGTINLNWGPNSGSALLAGDFLFTSSVYLFSDSELFFPQSAYMLATPGGRLTITRQHGYSGRVQVSYNITNGFYTNLTAVTLYGTNILETNFDGTTTSFTNNYFTNLLVLNQFSDLQFGRYVMVPEWNTTNIAITNANGLMSSSFAFSNDIPREGIPTQIDCNNSTTKVVTVDTNATPPVTNTLVTTFFCTNFTVTNVIPSAIPNADYIPLSGVVTFDDFQMSADLFAEIVNPNPIVEGSTPQTQPDAFLHLFGINHYLVGQITGVALDPFESATITPPTASTSFTNTLVDVLNQTTWVYSGDENAPHTFDSARFGTNVLNFERATLRCTRNVNGVGIARVYVTRTSLDYSSSPTVNYRIDHLKGPPTDNANNVFGLEAVLFGFGGNDEIPLQAGSDYATPPGSNSYGTDPDFESVTGQLSWGAYDGTAKPIDIPITNYNKVEFNEDLLLELYFPGSSATSPAATEKTLGNVHTCVLTILFDDLLPNEANNTNVTVSIQPAGAVDRTHNMDNDSSTSPAYNLHPGANSTVYAVAVQPDGRSVIAGDFTAYNTIKRIRLARMLSNGQIDTSFNPPGGANLFVSCLALDPAGNILAGGGFSSMNGINRNGIARLRPDGSLDTTFNPGQGANDTVWALALQTNGAIVVAGNFTTFNNLQRSYVARINANGSLDPNFVATPDGTVNAIAVQRDGRILIGGDFLNVSGAPRVRIARLNPDGSLDTTFDPGYGADGTVYSILVQPDGRALLGGSFRSVGAQPLSSIARLNTDGTVDQAFTPGDGANDTIYSLNLQPDGGIIAAGMFSSFNQTRRVGLVRLFTSGLVDTSFMDTAYNQFAGIITHYWDPNVEARNFIFSSALQPDGNLVIGGGFTRVGGGFTRDDVRQRENVARIVGGSTTGPGDIEFAKSSYSADQFSGQLFIELTRNNGSLGPSSVTIGPRSTAPGPGAAVDGVDYVFDGTTYGNPTYIVSWSAGGSGGTWQLQDGTFGQNQGYGPTIDPNLTVNYLQNDVYINILDNTNMGGNRQLSLKISNPSLADVFYLGGQNIPVGTALGAASAPLNILDFHTQPGVLSFSAPTYTVSKNGTNAIINVTRNNGTAGLVTVNYATANGTATNGLQYRAVSSQLRFLPGVTNQSFAVPIINDFVKEGDRTVLLGLSAATGGASLGVSNAVLTIVDTDIVGGYAQFSAPAVGNNGGGAFAIYGTNENSVYAAVTVNRNGGGAGILTVVLTATNGTAVNGLNFVGFTNLLTWVDGDVQPKTVPIRLYDDGVVQTAPLTVNLRLSDAAVGGVTNSPNINLGSPTAAVLYITNSDFPGQLAFSTANYSVNENGGPAIVTVIRQGGSAGAATINFAASSGTAVAGVDFYPTNGSLYFGPGEVSKSFAVGIIDNSVVNPPRFITLSLSSASPTNTLGFPNFALLNIIDDETFHQPPGGPDTTLDPSLGFNGNVQALWLQPDGKLLAGGDFTLADGASRNRIARLNSDFTLDTTFSSTAVGNGASDSVLAIVCQTDRRILIGGRFTTVNTINQNYLARLNADGSLDSTFIPGSAADNSVYALAETFVGTDRKLLIGGAFQNFNGLPHNNLVRLNNNGFVDTTFNPGSGPNGNVFAIAVQNDGKFLIGGDFTAVNGVGRNHVARLNPNGSVDLSFDPGSATDNSVRALAVQLDGRIVMGGFFTNVNAVALNRVARLNSNGSVDNTFTPGLGANDLVSSITVQPDTRIVLGGQFTSCNGVTRNRITRLNNDGTVDAMINFGLGANSFVSSTLVQTNGMIVFAGGFDAYDGQPHYRIARVYGGTVDGSGALEFGQPTYSVTEDATNAVISVRRRSGTSGDVSVSFNTSDGSAVSGVNYTSVSNLLFFPQGEVIQSVTIPVFRDFVVTTNLTVNLTLSNPQPPGGPVLGNSPFATLSIVNVDSGVSFASSVYSAPENVPSGFALINLVRNGSTNGSASVEFYTTTNGTAVALTNYVPTTNIVTFLPGQTNSFVTVPVIHELGYQGNATVVMQLTNANNTLLLTPSTATLTIVEVDQVPGQFIFSQTNFIVSEGVGLAQVTVLRTNGVSGVVTVDYATVPGTALPSVNYFPTNGTLAFADGETNKTIGVSIIQKNYVEGDTALTVALSNPTGGATIPGTGTVPLTILDDHVGVAFSSPVYITGEKNGSVTLTVNRVGTNGVTTVGYATTNVTAIAGTNYQASVGSLSFAPGELFKTFNIPVLYDPEVTGPLTFKVGLFNPSAPAQIYANNPAVVTINDADSGIAFTNANFYAVKGGTNVLISVSRSSANTGLTSVNYATSDGSAVAGVDYVPASGTLTFSNGIALQSFSVSIISNRLVEPDTYFNVFLLNPTAPGQLVAPSNAVVTITNNVSGVSFSTSNYRVNENGVTATITVLRTGYTNSTVSIQYATTDGTGKAGFNYVATSGGLLFTNGETVKTFTVRLIDDGIVNGDKTVLLNLFGLTGNAVLLAPNAATLTIVETDGSLIVPSGTALISESGPVNRSIDPQETVSVLFAFRNSEGTNTANLVANLLATNGIANPSGPQNYGVLTVHGPSISRPFTFTASATNGQVISATFQLTDGLAPTNLVVVNFSVGQTSALFSNTAPIIINDFTRATPYPSTNAVSGLPQEILGVTVTLTNLTHGSPSDIDVLLVSPAGQKSLIMAKVGSDITANNATLTLDDAAPSWLPDTTQLISGTYRPTSYAVAAPPFPSPAPPAPYATNLGVFTGSNPNGIWSLYIIDDTPLYAGVVSNGWLLHLTTASLILGDADLGVQTTTPSSAIVTSNLTITVTLTNYGPASASNIVVNESFAADAAFVSGLASFGSVSNTGAGLVAWTIPYLATNGYASMSFIIQPGSIGFMTNTASVTASTSDLNPDDSVATSVIAVSSSTADLALSLSGAPNDLLSGGTVTYTIIVTNLGPATATTVTATDFLPPGVTLVSAAPAGYLINGNSIVFTNLGDLGLGAQTSASLVVQVNVGGTLTNIATCSSGVTDPFKLNNSAAVKTVVVPIAVNLSVAGGNVVITWPAAASGYFLESTPNLQPPAVWTPVTSPPPVNVNGQLTVTLPLGAGTAYYRLHGP